MGRDDGGESGGRRRGDGGLGGALTDGADEFHLDAGVFEAFAVLGTHGDGALDGFAVGVEEDLFPLVFLELHVDGGSVVGVFEHDVDVDGGGEEVGHGAG